MTVYSSCFEYYPKDEEDLGHAIAIFPTPPLANEALARLKRRAIPGSTLSVEVLSAVDLAAIKTYDRQKAIIISTTEKTLPQHLIYPCPSHPLASTFPDLENARKDGAAAAYRSVAENRRLYLHSLPYGTTEESLQQMFKGFAT